MTRARVEIVDACDAGQFPNDDFLFARDGKFTDACVARIPLRGAGLVFGNQLVVVADRPQWIERDNQSMRGWRVRSSSAGAPQERAASSPSRPPSSQEGGDQQNVRGEADAVHGEGLSVRAGGERGNGQQVGQNRDQGKSQPGAAMQFDVGGF